MPQASTLESLRTRRRLLTGAAAGLGVFAVNSTIVRGEEVQASEGHEHGSGVVACQIGSARPWSDPATWPDGRVPGPGDTPTVSGVVLLDTDATVAGLSVPHGSSLCFASDRSVTLQSRGNVVIEGGLLMRPRSASIVHTLRFIEVDESRFSGHGMEVVDNDVGLWVMHTGGVDLDGAAKTAWARADGPLAAGAKSVRLSVDADGWRPGDRVVVTPTLPPTDNSSYVQPDEAIVVSVSGSDVTLDRPLRFDHPAVTVRPGITLAAEVLNLTRNVVIEGQPGGRAHTMIHAHRTQRLRNVELRHLGPRKVGRKGFPQKVVGRYPLHFHHCEDGSRGSIVEGTVVHSCRNHAFVPHGSHGIAFSDCVAHDIMETAWWYDTPTHTKDRSQAPTNDCLIERCVASAVHQHRKDTRQTRLSGFLLGKGDGNRCVSSVAAGVVGRNHASGFVWPEGFHGVWGFEDCVAHNSAQHGIFVWQNTTMNHEVDRFTGYHNGKAGILHGAYKNIYLYRDCTLYRNGHVGLEVRAMSRGDVGRLTFERMYIDQAGLTGYAVKSGEHRLPVQKATLFRECTLRGFTWAAVGFSHDTHPERYEFLDCDYAGRAFWVHKMAPGSAITVDDATHGRAILRRTDEAGTFEPEWNANVTVERPPGAKSAPATESAPEPASSEPSPERRANTESQPEPEPEAEPSTGGESPPKSSARYEATILPVGPDDRELKVEFVNNTSKNALVKLRVNGGTRSVWGRPGTKVLTRPISRRTKTLRVVVKVDGNVLARATIER